MPAYPIFWLATAVGFVILEAFTFSLVSVWFAVGAAAALFTCLVTESFRVQAVVFVAVSALCLLACKPLADRLRKPSAPTNADRIPGREATTLTPVSAQTTGRVRLEGTDWNARCSTPGDQLAPGDACRVLEVHSTLLVVEPIPAEELHDNKGEHS